MRRTPLDQQSEALARLRSELGERAPRVPANAGVRRTEPKVALLDRLDEIAAVAGRSPRFTGNR
jgi:hypothetical protein